MDLTSTKESCTCTLSPSPESATYLKHAATCQHVMQEKITITLEGIEVNAANWAEFVRRLKESGQKAESYFSQVINEEVGSALKYPELLG